MAGLCEATSFIAVHRHPHVERVVQALGAAPEMNAPQLVFARDVAQRLEWNRDFDRVTVARDHSLRLHHQIEAEVFTLAFGPNSIGLNAKRIEVKLVCATLIVEGV